MRLRVLIADDEPLGRAHLRHFLGRDPGIEIVAECAHGGEALEAIRRISPDLVFLDVAMPELDGFGVLAALNGQVCPAVVFVTAHEQFAVRAFENHAVDYLLKPFDQNRLQTAVQRARERLSGRTSHPAKASLENALQSLESRLRGLERITVKSGGRITILKTADVDWINSADNYVELHVGEKSHFLRSTIRALAEQLPKNQFIRINRSHLVNVDRIREIRPKSHGDYEVLLQDGTALPGTRNHRQTLAALLGRSV